MVRSHKLLLNLLFLVIIALMLTLVVSVWRRPMHDAIQKVAYVANDLEVLQVSAHEEEVMALLAVDEAGIGLARLHKEGLTFVVDEVYDDRFIQRNDYMEVLLASTNDRYYLVTKKLSSDIAGVMLLFLEESPKNYNLHGYSITDICEQVECLKQVDVGIDLAWYVFELETLSSLVILAYENDVVVGQLVPDNREIIE